MSWCKKCLQFLSPSMKHENYLCNWYFLSLNIFQSSFFGRYWCVKSTNRVGKEKALLILDAWKKKISMRKAHVIAWTSVVCWKILTLLCSSHDLSFSFLKCWNNFLCVADFFFVCFYYKKNLKFISWGWDTLESISIII